MSRRRLPGFRFETQPPPPRDVLPRMDVTVFVGFAASGPLHVPVAIEDPAGFRAIFGGDLPLAWDRRRGETVWAYLAPAVRAFFREGGRRCYVIRVAGDAIANRFALPGMAQVSLDALGSVTAVRPALAQARSEGSWADGMRVGTALRVETLGFFGHEPGGTLLLNGTAAPGDLLRLTYRDAKLTRLVVVSAVEAAEVGGIGSPPSPRRPAVRAFVRHALWLRSFEPTSPPLTIHEARVFGRWPDGETVSVVETTIVPMADEQRFEITLALALPLLDAPPDGSLITADLGSELLLLTVRQTRGDTIPASPPREVIRVTCEGMLCLKTAPVLPADSPLVERLTFELRARPAAGDPFALVELGFAEGHPRFWNELPTDSAWFSARLEGGGTSGLWRAAADPRFPLAGGLLTGAFTFPFTMSVLPEFELLPYPATDDPLTRDGLAEYRSALFMDEALIGTTMLDLLGRADSIRYQGDEPRMLKGMHAALALDEATLIAVPDALHPGWSRESDPIAPDAYSSDRLPQPDRSRFIQCAFRILNAPMLRASDPDAVGTFTLSWEWTTDRPTDTPTFVLEEAGLPDFSDAVVLNRGAAQAYTIYGRARGVYYYRVRAEIDPHLGDWSNGINVRVAPGEAWVMADSASVNHAAALVIHRALVRMCAARGDMMAVLALPEHFHEDDALDHVRALSPFSTDYDADDPFDFPLSGAEAKALSYAALYHPWLHMRDGSSIRALPPDGALCGLMARRTLERGAWIAPANLPLTGVAALTPPLNETRWLDLLAAQINIVKPSPDGFVPMTADTLSIDPDLRPLNVRRLLILLRRLALREGAQYVFEPFDDTFRRQVQRAFEALLEMMFARGAFAGRTSAAAFQVVPRSTALDRDNGRFIVDLRVAPSLPMEFVTVRLVQSGDRSLVTEE